MHHHNVLVVLRVCEESCWRIHLPP
jgi:hypothetical protein